MLCQTRRIVFLVLLGLGSTVGIAGGKTPETATATPVSTKPQETSPELRQQLRQTVNRNTVELITSGISGTHSQIADDIARVMSSEQLRVLPVVGRSTLENITDLLYLQGIDMAIAQIDDLRQAQEEKPFLDLRQHIQYVSKLFNEEIHLLASTEVEDLAGLAGRRVNLGREDSASAITMQRILDTLGVPVQATYFNHEQALTLLEAGEITAMAFVTGKPAPLFKTLGGTSPLHFISIPYDTKLLEDYLPARLEHADYPRLIHDHQSVETIAVGTVLVAYHWPVHNQRSEELAAVVEQLFEHIDKLRDPPYHPKWREVSLSAVLPGWTRHPAAHRWLESARQP